MKRYFVALFSLLLFGSVTAFGQTGDDYNKNEFYVGGLYQRIDNTAGKENGFGGEVAYVRNFSRYFGVKADFSAAIGGKRSFTQTIFTGNSAANNLGTGPTPNTLNIQADTQVYNFLGGIQVKDNASKSRVKPFGYALAGANTRRDTFDIQCSGCTSVFTGRNSDTRTRFAAAFGGGIDVKLNEKLDLRVIKVDYNPVFVRDFTDHHFRVGFGIVFK